MAVEINGGTDGIRRRNVNGSTAGTTTDQGKKADELLDKHVQ
jgi:hypothetical protein